jgi:HEPN domain-containing protein
VRTAKQEDAEKRAGELYARARERADLRPRDAPVLGALSPIFAAAPHVRLLDEARIHIDHQRYELAVVRAQTACEVYARLALDLLARDVAEHGKRPSSLFRNASLGDPADRALLRALTGYRIGAEERWGSYRAHVQRRNEIVHAGISVTEPEAEESMDAADAFIPFLQARWAGSPGVRSAP